MTKPFSKGIATAQTIVNLVMLLFIWLNATSPEAGVIAYLLFALVQYGIIIFYDSNIMLSSLLDILFSGVSLLIPYTIRIFIGEEFIPKDTIFTSEVVAQHPLFTGDHMIVFGLGFYFVTRFLGVGMGLCLSQAEKHKQLYT
ncbi:hypothetical protein [Vibrio maerlii]|uniref:hypothetical protein n=1 Tax=Vibrio maerlii TaxID=2231648 RepID=UPI000E3E9BDD|nr:hypothetical protein [Vibrio maerlii]